MEYYILNAIHELTIIQKENLQHGEIYIRDILGYLKSQEETSQRFEKTNQRYLGQRIREINLKVERETVGHKMCYLVQDENLKAQFERYNLNKPDKS